MSDSSTSSYRSIALLALSTAASFGLVGACTGSASQLDEEPGLDAATGGTAGVSSGGSSGKGGGPNTGGTAPGGSGGAGGTKILDAGEAGDAPPDIAAETKLEAEAEAGPFDPLSLIAIPCKDTVANFYDIPDGLPAYDSSRRGDVVRCLIDRFVPGAELQDAAQKLFYKGNVLESGTRVLRIAYRTERLSNLNGVPVEGISSALLLLPEVPRAGTAPQPLVVAAHGSIGIAESCAPSRTDITALGNHLDDAHSLYLPLAGAGWLVVAPDYAGFGYGSTTAWSLAEDEAHSLLDATRAVAKALKPGTLSGKSVIVGHSQGGHAAFAAHAFHQSYGLEGTLVGVATFAPLWINSGAWGAALSPVLGFNTTDNKGTLAYSIDYFLGHGEVYDGPGHGTDVFQETKRDAVRKIFETQCLREAENHLVDLGVSPTDFYDQGFALGVSTCVVSGICVGTAQETWMPRFKADRPSIDPKGPPIVIWAGAKDDSITPGRIKCALDRMQANLAAADNPTTKIRVCADTIAVHSGFLGDRPDLSDAITRRGMDWVNQWIEARTLGGAEPPVCLDESGLSSEPLVCDTPPPNDE